ncbi:Hypothetical predicted protein [Mytilus galloprovincialis]|uniref:Uncharacterized protein n=1 Tax=Mytilus galloprovincialis TaxID=29158 RepID=A0A8B6GPD5_MYTGA|nr:Hypothetical predicted protein [Mytilus galloprovincialis]
MAIGRKYANLCKNKANKLEQEVSKKRQNILRDNKQKKILKQRKTESELRRIENSIKAMGGIVKRSRDIEHLLQISKNLKEKKLKLRDQLLYTKHFMNKEIDKKSFYISSNTVFNFKQTLINVLELDKEKEVAIGTWVAVAYQNGWFPGEEALELKVENVDAFKLKQLELEHELKLKELEMKEMEKIKGKELEMKERLEMDKKEKEDEFKLKELEMKERLDIEKMKLKWSRKKATLKSSRNQNILMQQKIRLVPRFCGKKTVDRYFPQFEKIAHNLHWPKPFWTTMQQSVFEGKAAKYTPHFHQKKVADYDTVNTEV